MPKPHLSRRDFIDRSAVAMGSVGLAAGAGRVNTGQPVPNPLNPQDLVVYEKGDDSGLKVRYGLNLLVYTATFSKDQTYLIKKVADMGYDGVEIPFNDLSVLDAKATNKAREQAGMGLTSCVVLLPGTSITSPDADERKAGVKRLRDVIDITADMGGNAVAGPIYSPVGYHTGLARSADEWKWAVECMRAAAEHAETKDILLAIEPLNRFETHVFNTVADTIAFVNEVDHPKVTVQIDTFHCNIEEKDTAAAIRAAGPVLGHFHASESDRGVPGTGQVSWKECFAALRDVNYEGWITIESFATGIVDLCAAACIWRPIYDTADGLAVDGLAFLKRTANSV